jgi:hypothetical protein
MPRYSFRTGEIGSSLEDCSSFQRRACGGVEYEYCRVAEEPGCRAQRIVHDCPRKIPTAIWGGGNLSRVRGKRNKSRALRSTRQTGWEAGEDIVLTEH